MSMFTSVNSIELLKREAPGSTEFPPAIKEKLVSCEDVEMLAQGVVEWLNKLILEYNNKIKTEQETIETTQANYDVLLYNTIKECLPFVPLQCKPVLLKKFF